MLASRLRDVFFENAAKEWEIIEIRLNKDNGFEIANVYDTISAISALSRP